MGKDYGRGRVHRKKGNAWMRRTKEVHRGGLLRVGEKWSDDGKMTVHRKEGGR